MIRALQSLFAWTIGIVILAGAVHATAVILLPGLIMGGAMNKVSQQSGVNAVFHSPAATHESRTVVRPSPDLLYSGCAFNLTQTNLRVSAPVPAEGYWSLAFFDANTDTFLVQNNQGDLSGSLDILLVGRGQDAPRPMARAQLKRQASKVSSC